jgi:two-component system, NarL family, response regulator DegU
MTDQNPPKIIQVVVVDDHPFFRDGIMSRLHLEPDITAVRACEDGESGLATIRELQPDIAIMDVNLPDINGLQVIKQIRSANLATRIIVLTAHHDIQQTLHVIRSGAHAYAAKDIPPDRMVAVVRRVAKGYYIIDDKALKPSQVRQWINEQIAELSAYTVEDGEEYYTPLSPREMEILTFVTNGKSNKEISAALSISQQTVKNHMTSILRKLNVSDRTQAAVTALRHGWVRLRK